MVYENILKFCIIAPYTNTSMATSSVVDVDLLELLTAVEEIKLLRIKYERLIQISRTLLKPW